MAQIIPNSTKQRLEEISDRILLTVPPEDYKFVKNCYKRFGKKAVFEIMGLEAIIFCDMEIERYGI